MWLDNASTSLVLQRFDSDSFKLARMLDEKTKGQPAASPFASATNGCPVCREPLATTKHADITLDYCSAHGTFFDRGELARVLAITGRRTAPPAAPVAGPSLSELQTSVRHDLAWQDDPLGTQLLDWLTGGKDWVNRWRR